MAREFLEKYQVDIIHLVDARKFPVNAEDAWNMVKKAEQVFATRGKRVYDWQPGPETKEELLKAILGRSGNLRAPALQMNKFFVIGFNEELFKQFLAQ